MDGAVLRNGSRRLVVELVIVGLLVGLPVDFPTDFATAGAAWSFLFGHPTFLLHAVVGTVVLGEAVSLVLREVAARGSSLVIAGIGLACVLLAYGTGALFVGDGRQESWLTLMTIGWVGALVAYSVGWVVGRRALARSGISVAR